MPSKLSRSIAVRVLVGILVCWFDSTLRAQAQPSPWQLIRVPDPLARRATIAALDGAPRVSRPRTAGSS